MAERRDTVASPIPGAGRAAAFLHRRLVAGLDDDAALTRLDAGVGSVVVWILVLALPVGLLGQAGAPTAGLVLLALAAVGLLWSVRALHGAGLARSVAAYRGGLLMLAAVLPLTLLGVAAADAGEELVTGLVGLGAAAFGSILYTLSLRLAGSPDGRPDDA